LLESAINDSFASLIASLKVAKHLKEIEEILEGKN
jgi:hypothetical protein